MRSTFDVLPFDSLDGDIRVVNLVVALEDIAVLSGTYLAFEDIIVDHFRHSLDKYFKIRRYQIADNKM